MGERMPLDAMIEDGAREEAWARDPVVTYTVVAPPPPPELRLLAVRALRTARAARLAEFRGDEQAELAACGESDSARLRLYAALNRPGSGYSHYGHAGIYWDLWRYARRHALWHDGDVDPAERMADWILARYALDATRTTLTGGVKCPA